MNKRLYLILLTGVFSMGTAKSQNIDIQGHRGARGLLPENTIIAFKKALDLGVQTLELDVVITHDKQVLISHEPFLSSEICLDDAGEPISKEKEKEYNLFHMSYEQIKKFDCGSKGNRRFPEQEKQVSHKPLLKDMILEIEQYIKINNLPKINYNIELKSLPEGDNLFHPEPSEFSRLVYQTIKDLLPAERVIIQSFDKRALQHWKKKYPGYRLAYLVEEYFTPQEIQEELGFKIDIFSPYYETLTKKAVEAFQKEQIEVIPWTVNEPEDMKRLISWKVDGLITDYPDRAKTALSKP